MKKRRSTKSYAMVEIKKGEEVMTMTVRCAWCSKDLGTKEGREGISHGICQECYQVMMVQAMVERYPKIVRLEKE